MRLSTARKIISSAIKHNIALAESGTARNSQYVTPMLWGAPGLGKTTIIEDETAALGINLATWILAQYDAGELGGFPILVDTKDGKRMQRCRPGNLPNEGTGVLFLDEFPQSPLANQNIAAQLINERRIGDHRLGDGWTIVCAGNDIKHRAGTNQMPSHVKDRLLHLEVEADTNDALEYFNSKAFTPELVGFLRYRPEYLHKFDPDQKASPTPRSWERVDSVLKWKLGTLEEQQTIAGLVGGPASADFAGFLRVFRELPDPDAPFKTPMTAVVPDDPSVLYALMASLSARVEGKTIKNMMAYLARVPHKEFVVCCMKDTLTRNPKLHQHKDATEWLRTEGANLVL
jgi:hypothetical protein